MDGEHDAHISADIEVKPGPLPNQVQIFTYSGDEGQITNRFMVTVDDLTAAGLG